MVIRKFPSRGPGTSPPGRPSPEPDYSVNPLVPGGPLPTARAFIARAHTVDGLLALRHQGGVFYAYSPGVSAYIERDEAEVRADLYRFLDKAQRWTKSEGTQPDLVRYEPNKSRVENVLDALRAECNLPTSRGAPCWLQDDPHLDPLDILAGPSGLLHIPTRDLLPATPAFFTLTGLDFAFDAQAPEPARWLRFLEELWPNDLQSRDTLQEFMGYLLTPRTHLQKALMVVGPRRSGKGTIGRVTRRLLGDRNVCNPTLASMGSQFGISSLIGRTAAIIADARISGRTDTSVVTERLLSISGEDPQTIQRKYLPDWNGKLPTRFVVMTNLLPNIEDASGALVSRFVVLKLQESFFGREDHGLSARLVPELPAILNWALTGWDRLYARGRFVQPQSAAGLIQVFEDLGSPIGAFVREKCVVGRNHAVQKHQLFQAWQAWCATNGRDQVGTTEVFGRNLRAAIPSLGENQLRVDGTRVWHHTGIRLRDGND